MTEHRKRFGPKRPMQSAAGDDPRGPVRTYEEVRKEWHRRSGQLLNRQTVWFICHNAIRKLRKALEEELA